ncbi:NUDIX hydrolase [Cytophagaceae bacterium DM2B3-1]|uniref:NUDIX hydrolase n=1 Tax=Xanthocytophaga flava TaxID=3048013 RepID=A0ABT7CX07_9BACT|nr:NUDIX hydrolase [Xanthocytophaga flavus]MDJ1467411.1 NUDIX hydrolase [Xanthocytophaga flavus]MDJ1498051.1 NUDIX hydrolase [Xanthocytophaga flavus]
MQSEEILQKFGNQLRVRVCGICIQEDKVLLVNLRHVTRTGDLWCPPGGGMQVGETAPETLIREFEEETGLKIEVGEFMFVNEFTGNSLHAVELFFRVTILGGVLRKGYDPELAQQVLEDVAFLSFEEIHRFQQEELHNLFRYCSSLDELLAIRGYYQLKI